MDNIGLIYSETIKRELVFLEIPYNDALCFSFKGYLSNANYSNKKSTYLFFINNRLVDCSPLRKAFDAFYTTLLPKGGRPFVYCSLTLDASNIDVNVHPTKSEVYFMDEEEIVQVIIEALGTKLVDSGSSRKFEPMKAVTSVLGIPTPPSNVLYLLIDFACMKLFCKKVLSPLSVKQPKSFLRRNSYGQTRVQGRWIVCLVLKLVNKRNFHNLPAHAKSDLRSVVSNLLLTLLKIQRK